MNQKSSEDTVNKRFSELKSELDASKSYLIFENDLKRSKDSILTKSLPIYQYLKSQGFDWQKIKDNESGREYLIVQTRPGNEDKILGRLMGCSLPDDIVYYLYKATS